MQREGLHEPVYRVSKTTKANSPIDALAAPEAASQPRRASRIRWILHWKSPAKSLDHIEQNIRDYTCTLVKRERVQGELLDYEFMHCKVRHERVEDGQRGSVRRLPELPQARLDEGARGDLRRRGTIAASWLPTRAASRDASSRPCRCCPPVRLALRGNRYPITEIGIKTLTERLIEKGSRDRRLGDCEVRMVDGAKVKDRVCTMLEVKHLDRRPEYEFCVARIFLDNELNMPIRYEAYDWPRSPDGPPELIEEYTYINVQLNVGLQDEDFSTENPNYRF